MNETCKALRIHYDEKMKKLFIFDKKGESSSSEAPLMEFELSTLEKKGWNEAGRHIGEPILSLIAETRDVFLGTSRQAREEAIQARDELNEQHRKAAEENDATAQFNLAMYYLSMSQKGGRVDFMEIAETLLKKAAGNGHTKAIKLLDENGERIKSDLGASKV
jgi:TPR repeat protein